MSLFDALLRRVETGHDLEEEEARAVFTLILGGGLDHASIASMLLAIRNKGESVSEISGAARAMRARMNAIAAPEGAIDIAGTGGDGHGTLNVSTAAALIAAGAGAVVAKHGGRAGNSATGPSDVLAALQVNIEPPLAVLERGLREIGLAFLFTPRHHPALCFVAPVRRKLGVRTIFNLLGPLTNPAGVRRHLIGVFNRSWSRSMAESLAVLGSKRAWIAHGSDGLDEISTTGITHITALENGALRTFETTPRDASVPLASLSEIQGGDAKTNAAAMRRLLDGEGGAYRDIAVLNAGAALVIADRAKTLADGAALAARAIDSGAARAKLDALIKITNGG